MAKASKTWKLVITTIIITLIILAAFTAIFLSLIVPAYDITRDQIYDILIRVFPILIGLVFIEIALLIAKRPEEDIKENLDKLAPNAYDSPLYTPAMDDPMLRGKFTATSAALETMPKDRASELFDQLSGSSVQAESHPAAAPTPTTIIKEVPVEVEKIVERIVEKEVPVEVIREVPIEIIKEVEVEKVIEKEVPVEVEKIVERVVEKEVPVEVEKIIEKEVPVTIEKIVEKEVPVEIIKEVEKIVEKEVPVEVIKEVVKEIPVEVEKVVEKIVPIEIEKIVEKEVEKIVEKEVPVEVIKEVERIVEKEVPVEVIKEVEKVVEKEVPVEVIKEIEKEVPVEVETEPEAIIYDFHSALEAEIEEARANNYDLSLVAFKDADKSKISSKLGRETILFDESSTGLTYMILPLYEKSEAEKATRLLGARKVTSLNGRRVTPDKLIHEAAAGL